MDSSSRGRDRTSALELGEPNLDGQVAPGSRGDRSLATGRPRGAGNDERRTASSTQHAEACSREARERERCVQPGLGLVAARRGIGGGSRGWSAATGRRWREHRVGSPERACATRRVGHDASICRPAGRAASGRGSNHAWPCWSSTCAASPAPGSLRGVDARGAADHRSAPPPGPASPAGHPRRSRPASGPEHVGVAAGHLVGPGGGRHELSRRVGAGPATRNVTWSPRCSTTVTVSDPRRWRWSPTSGRPAGRADDDEHDRGDRGDPERGRRGRG